MAPTTPADVARAAYAAYDARDLDRYAELLADNVEWTTVAYNHTLPGREAVRAFLQGWLSAFPDSRVTVDHQVPGPESVATEFTFTGTQTGTLMTPRGALAPTGKTLMLHTCEIYEVRDGQITACRTYFDAATIQAALGS